MSEINNSEDDTLDLPQIIDASKLVVKKACDWKFNLKYMQMMNAPGSNIHLHFGGCLASSMETYRRSIFQSNLDNEPAQLRGIRRLVSEWGDHPNPEFNYKTLETCILTFHRYTSIIPAREDPYQPHHDGSIEFSFAFPLDAPGFAMHPSGEPFIYCGRFDMLAQDSRSSRSYVEPLDEKTTQGMGVTWPDQWSLRFQLLGYCWVLNKLGFKSQSAVIRGLGILKNSTKIATANPRFPSYMLERFEDNLKHLTHELSRSYYHNSWPYSFGDACTNYGGCEFMEACRAKREKAILKNNFVYREWNPLSKNPQAEPVSWEKVHELIDQAKAQARDYNHVDAG